MDLSNFLKEMQDLIWSAPLLAFILGTGLYLTYILRGMQFRYLGYAIKQVFAPVHKGSKGDISHFEALMTSLAGAIGTGSIVGVATALTIGGMGAMFWMWITALVGMATKYAESLLAVKYRDVDSRGEMIGGPMEYMQKGLGWKKMALFFAFLGAVAAFGTGNLVQVNSIAEAAENVWSIDPWITGVVLAVLTGMVLVGGVKSIGHVAGVLVPGMALFYMVGGAIIIGLHYDKIPEAFGVIFTSAFQGQAAVGGFAGATIMMAIQAGVSRSIFSNEAGLGISAIAAAAAKTDSPGRQAMITMTGALMSTVVVCTVTALVLGVTGVVSGVNGNGVPLSGASMAIEAFRSTIFGGEYIVTIGLILFAFSTVIAWAYYGEKCCEYLFGERSILPYRTLFTLAVIPGAAIQMETAWYFANIANGVMAVPNLVALICLTGVIVSETRLFLDIVEKEEEENKLMSKSTV